MKTKLKNSLNRMAELALEQVFNLSDCLEDDNFELAGELILRDDLVDSLEKEIDMLSEKTILEAATSCILPDGQNIYDGDFFNLTYAISAVRINHLLERIGDHVVNGAQVFLNGNIRKGMFKDDPDLNLALSRMVTIVGMTVESMVEEKSRFFGSVQTVENELDGHCQNFFHRTVEDEGYSRKEFSDIYRIILGIERIGDNAADIAKEMVRLKTGTDMRHLSPDESVRLADFKLSGL